MNQKISKIKVGTSHIGYPELRNFAGLPLKKFEVVKCYDVCKIYDYLKFKVTGNNSKFCHNFHTDIGFNKGVKLFHFFNTVSSTSKPWIVTNEYGLPRYNEKSELGYKLLAKDNCKKIISFCHKAKNVFEHYLSNFPQYKELLLSKTEIIHPAQQLHVQSIDEKNYTDDTVVFSFVGGAFFGKGGYETVKAYEKLINEGYNFKLNIVTGFFYGNYKDEHITDKDIHEVKRIIARYPEHMTHHPHMSNQDVLKLMKNSHVGLLPSYGETYGYTILEFQACGNPVITSNVPPFDEINTDDIGWRVEVPLIKQDGTFGTDVYTIDKRKILFDKLTENLYKQAKEIIINPNQIKTKAAASIEKIREKNNIETIAARIEKIYEDALG